MKNIILLLAFMFQITISYAQQRDEVGHAVTTWSNWSTTACHKGIAWRFRQSFYSGNSGGFTWEYEVKNNYGRQVAFSFQFSESDASSGNTPMRKTLAANQVYRNTALPNASKINYFVFSVCFSADGRCKDECYSPCDNGTPNIPDCANSSSSLSGSRTSTASNTVQNTQTYTSPQQTKAQKQAQALNVISGSLMDLAKSFDKAKAEKREKQQREVEAKTQTSYIEQAAVEANNGTDDGYRKAANLLLSHVSELNGDELNTLGFYFWKQKDYTNSFKYFKMAASKGSDIGIYDLAYAYENGHGTTVDKNIAFYYYSKVSANYSDIASVYHQLGHLCEEGYNSDSNKSDFQAAYNYFIKGANLGEVSCMFHLGDYYNNGGKLATDLQKAKYWYQKACDLKNEKACDKLNNLK
ncbi:tetratricopeptide repeat protein [Pedobacter sp. ASV28]|uniref:tetratricopeptide repeat protein n=1 Tax=Pedobacter sp. ASV28 TaxID=2795123 RepID=UPI0018EA8B1A|nr:tetratricopeptide repeat protein [Pedobacter sp. ASV28]